MTRKRKLTILDQRDAQIVRLSSIDGLSCRKTAKQVGVHASTVTRVLNAFRVELSVFVGPLNHKTPNDLRAITIAVLDRAASIRGTAA